MFNKAQRSAKTPTFSPPGWPYRYPIKANSAVKKTSILTLWLIIFFSTKLIASDPQQPPTTEKIIQQAEYLFQGKVISLQPATDKRFYKIRLLQSSGTIILIQADKKSGAMSALNTQAQ